MTLSHLVPPRVSPERSIQCRGVVAQHLPRPYLAPIRLAAVRIITRPQPKPLLVKPVPAANPPLRIRRLRTHDRDTSNDDGDDARELHDDEEAVELGGDFGADGVGEAHDGQDEDGEELMGEAVALAGDARGGVGGLDEDDGEDGEGGGHDGYDPGPGGEEAEGVTVDVLEVRLYPAWVMLRTSSSYR
jgi:hypothetical protein